jgi:hypothetical protein
VPNPKVNVPDRTVVAVEVFDPKQKPVWIKVRKIRIEFSLVAIPGSS